MSAGVVRLSDSITPEVYMNYLSLNTVQKVKLMQSGIIRQDAVMASRLTAGGVTFQTPFWGDLDDDGSAIGSDDPSRVLTPSKLGASKHQFVRQFRTKAWSVAKLVEEVVGSDPMARITERTAPWWGREFDKLSFSTIKGFLADNIANDSGDMVYDVRAVAGTYTVNGESVNKSAMSARVVLDGKQQLGDDASESLKKIMMHSVVYTNLQKQQLITFREPAGANIRIPMYLDYEVIVSDRMPVEVDGADLIYTSYLSGADIMGFGENPPDIPVEVKREPLQGNGAGVEILVERRQFALSPYWFSFTNNTVSDEFPTTADLELAVNWDRKATERKQIPFVAIKTKNG
jgi:hypothetical protein